MGVLRWRRVNSLYGNAQGWFNCTTLSTPVQQPAVVVAPDDILNNQAPSGPNQTLWCNVAAGFDFPNTVQSHASCGDSGGPVLVGTGPTSKGLQPDALPAPAPGDTYNPQRNYVAGTASVYAEIIDGHPSTAYNPTYTLTASTTGRESTATAPNTRPAGS